MIVWSGGGVIVPVIAFLFCLVGVEGTALIVGPTFSEHGRGIAAAVSLLFAGAACGWLGTRLRRIDPKRNDTFFFIPVQWWGIPLAIFAFYLVFGETPAAHAETAAQARPSASAKSGAEDD